MLRRTFVKLAATAAGTVLLSGCAALTGASNPAGSDNQTASVTGIGIIDDEDFGDIILEITIDQVESAGIEYGDSVDIALRNGYSAQDVPYLNDFFARNGAFILCGYSGDGLIYFVREHAHLWEESGVSESDTATITLAEKGKYLDRQEAIDFQLVTDRSECSSDEMFANFRPLSGGMIWEGAVYRSSSPCDNKLGRASYVDALLEKYGIAFALDLADDDDEIQEFMADESFNSPYFAALYQNGKVAPINLDSSYASGGYKAAVAGGLRKLLQSDGPYLVFCQTGKDRTGFVSALLEALCGASRDEIVYDYLLTYSSLYGIDLATEQSRCEILTDILFTDSLCCIAGTDDSGLASADFAQGARAYLQSAGMSDEEIDSLVAKLSREDAAHAL